MIEPVERAFAPFAVMEAPARLHRAVVACVVAAAAVTSLHAAELHEATARAFDTYAAAVEARPAAPFLWLETLPAPRRERELRDVREGGLVIERLRARSSG